MTIVSHPPFGLIRDLQRAFTDAGIETAVGGSAILLAHGVIDTVGDWDLMSDGEPDAVREVLCGLGLDLRREAPSGVFASAALYRVDGGDHQIDVICGFALRAEGRIHRIPLRRAQVWRGLVLSEPGPWALAYRLMARPERASLLEAIADTAR